MDELSKLIKMSAPLASGSWSSKELAEEMEEIYKLLAKHMTVSGVGLHKEKEEEEKMIRLSGDKNVRTPASAGVTFFKKGARFTYRLRYAGTTIVPQGTEWAASKVKAKAKSEKKLEEIMSTMYRLRNSLDK